MDPMFMIVRNFLSKQSMKLKLQTWEICNPGYNILALFNNLAQVRIATSKTILDI